jgi:epoxyqueuosine reductase
MKSNLISKLRQNIPILFITLAWSGFIFVLIGTPMERGIEIGVSFFDKFVHFILFGVEAELIFLLMGSLGMKKVRSFFYSFILALGFASFSEYYQSFVPGRTPSELDLMAGVIGMLFFLVVAYGLFEKEKPKLLLHICCAGCGAYAAELLRKDFDVYLVYSNSNIYPKLEFEKRKEDINKIAEYLSLGKRKIIYEDYAPDEWREETMGLECEKEGGARCIECFRYRFTKTAEIAKKYKIKYFTSTLTVSPHKNAEAINKIGLGIGQKYKLIFLPVDLKKADGYKKSIELSKKLDLYRQNYCGCEFSIRK